MAFVPPPVPGTMAMSASVSTILLMAGPEARATSAMMIRRGPGFFCRYSLIDSFNSPGSTITCRPLKKKGSVPRRNGSHPASRAATTTSHSIIWANFSLSGSSRTQESRVLGFLGLKGIRAGTDISLQDYVQAK